MAALGLAPTIDHAFGPALPRQHVREIQGLRALAVTSVVAYHLSPGALPGGFVGVDVFFVISGYLITSLILREVELRGRVDLRRFWERRVRRLIPAQVTVAVVSAIAAVAVFPGADGPGILRQVPTAVLNVHNVALGRSSVDYLAQESSSGVLDHYWSLAIEEQFYLGLPLVLAALAAGGGAGRAFRRRACLTVGVIFLLSAMYLAVSLPGWSPSDYFSTGMRVWQIAAGALLALGIRRLPASSRVLVLVGRVGVVVILAAVVLVDGESAYPSLVAAVPVGGTVLALWAFAHPARGARSRLLASRPLVAIGDWSYSIYLVHWPVIVISEQIAGGQVSSALRAAQLAAIAGLSLLLHRFVETPLRHGPSTSLRRSVLWPALATMVGVAGAASLAATLLAGVHAGRLDTVPTGLGSPYGAPALQQPGGPHFLAGDVSVHPDPANAARLDLPLLGMEDCQIEPEDRDPHLCELGASAPAPTVLLLGDSHATQWLPAVRAIADERGWRILTLLHSSCAFSTVPRAYSPAAESACRDANEATAELVAERDDVDLVLTSALAGDSFAGSTTDPGVGARGFAAAWRELVSQGVPVVAIRDNPRFVGEGRVTDCVRRDESTPQRCDLDRAASLFADDQEAAVRATPGTALVDLTDHMCTGDVCPAVIGSVLVYRDNNHLTATFARSLARALDHELGSVCARTLECGELLLSGSARALARGALRMHGQDGHGWGVRARLWDTPPGDAQVARTRLQGASRRLVLHRREGDRHDRRRRDPPGPRPRRFRRGAGAARSRRGCAAARGGARGFRTRAAGSSARDAAGRAGRARGRCPAPGRRRGRTASRRPPEDRGTRRATPARLHPHRSDHRRHPRPERRLPAGRGHRRRARAGVVRAARRRRRATGTARGRRTGVR